MSSRRELVINAQLTLSVPAIFSDEAARQAFSAVGYLVDFGGMGERIRVLGCTVDGKLYDCRDYNGPDYPKGASYGPQDQA